MSQLWKKDFFIYQSANLYHAVLHDGVVDATPEKVLQHPVAVFILERHEQHFRHIIFHGRQRRLPVAPVMVCTDSTKPSSRTFIRQSRAEKPPNPLDHQYHLPVEIFKLSCSLVQQTLPATRFRLPGSYRCRQESRSICCACSITVGSNCTQRLLPIQIKSPPKIDLAEGLSVKKTLGYVIKFYFLFAGLIFLEYVG